MVAPRFEPIPGIETLILESQLTIAKLIKSMNNDSSLTILLLVVKTMLRNQNNTTTEIIGYAGPHWALLASVRISMSLNSRDKSILGATSVRAVVMQAIRWPCW